MAEKTSRFSIKSIAINLIFLIFMLLLCIVLLEILLRVVRPPIIQGFVRQPAIYVADADLGYRYAPSSTSRLIREGEFETHIVMNSHGFYDDEFSDAKADDVTRIAVVGDSFTVAFQVDRGETFSDVMELRLNSDSICNCEVYNFGVDGYGTQNERIMLETIVLDFQPDIVIHQLYENDVFGSQMAISHRESYRGFNIYYELYDEPPAAMRRVVDRHLEDPLQQFFFSNASDILLLRVLHQLFMKPDNERNDRLMSNIVRGFSRYNTIQYDEDQARIRMVDDMQAMKDLCEDAGCEYVVILLPEREYITGEIDLHYAVPIVRKLDETEITYWDITEAMKAHVQDGNSLFFPNDGHNNADGHAFIASQLIDLLVENDYFGD